MALHTLRLRLEPLPVMQSFTNSRHIIYVCLSFSSVCLTSTEKLYKDLKFWFPSLKTPTISHFSNIKSTWIQNQQKPHPRFTTLRPRRRVLDLVANTGLPIKLLPNICFIDDFPSCIKDFLIVIEQQEANLIKKQKEERRALREKKLSKRLTSWPTCLVMVKEIMNLERVQQ